MFSDRQHPVKHKTSFIFPITFRCYGEEYEWRLAKAAQTVRYGRGNAVIVGVIVEVVSWVKR